jgi:acyl-CoA synthetase (AMP-forming)/AMP-acid ligase II
MMQYRSLIHRAARMYGELPAIICGDTTLSFTQMVDRATRLGNVLVDAGCQPGDRIGVLMPNCAEYMELDAGLAAAGFVRVSLNVRSTTGQQIDVLTDAGVKALIYDEQFASVASAILQQLDGLRRVLRLRGGSDDGEIRDYEAALAAASADPLPADPSGEDLYCLFYTSGTSGRPKGVMLSHRAYFAVALLLLLEFGPVRAGDTAVLTQPLSHGGGFFMLPWFLSGATSVVMPKYDAAACIELTERHEAAVLKVVPTMLLQMLAAGIEPPPLPALQKIIYGASPMPAQQLRELLERFGNKFLQLYGQAEAPMTITVLGLGEHAEGGRLLSSAGRPWRGVEVRVVDEDGLDVEPGASGEVVVRGPQLMTGYWHQPELTAQTIRDGWLHTKDIAEEDERGYVYLLGRSDEMIISGGFNVSPRVVEDVLNRHPAVLESAVLGLPHEILGQQVTAFVSLRADAPASPDELIEHAGRELGYQKPRHLQIIPKLPRNAYGKVAFAELRELAAQTESR